MNSHILEVNYAKMDDEIKERIVQGKRALDQWEV